MVVVASAGPSEAVRDADRRVHSSRTPRVQLLGASRVVDVVTSRRRRREAVLTWLILNHRW
jgi:hypothetical protein